MTDEPGIPTAGEIRQLPRWAQVAFAARCARWVMPIFEAWPSAKKEDVAAVKGAIMYAERAAANAAAEDAVCILRTRQAARATGAAGPRYAAAAAAADAAADAVAADEDAADAAAYAGAADAADAAYAADAPEATARIAHKAATEPAGIVASGIRRDFERLENAAEKEDWTDETPVNPEFFGPLWSKEQEVNWKKAREAYLRPGRKVKGAENLHEDERLRLCVYTSESTNEDELVDRIVELYRALNEYHIACGGRGLTIDDWHIFVRQARPAGVPV